ncbi:caspase-8 isoform X1 [Clarias gariepinus]|uniref:caspase-8 isoform X1 n=1 Tax=Clarias gariepinus TaxID=13013 RepID=UPI00234C1015|nr:caspase-8 isoform X1 [Clarias gariepinus]
MEGQQSSKVPEFQEILLQVQNALSLTEVQELVFLCTEMLSKDLSSVDTASRLFVLLQDHDLLSAEDLSLLLELLKIIKRDKLIRDLQLNPRQLSSRVSLYRQMLFELSENISDNELKDIKFLLHETLPRRKLQKEVTTLQLFLEMEKEGCMGADDLSTIEKLIGSVCPRLKKIISVYQMNGVSVPEDVKRKDKSNNQDTSITTRPVPPEDTACATYNPDLTVSEELLPPSYFNQLPSTEMRSGLMSISGDVQDQVAHLSLSENQNLTQGETNPSFPETNQNTLTLRQYDMNGDWRGFALIISNYDFSHSHILSLKNREGTDVDEKSLADVFQWLGFETIIKQDCSKESMLSALNELRNKDHTNADCVVCCVLTHGYEGGLYGVDEGKVLLKDLIKLLDGEHCPSLRQKPKLFFIQACQGSQEQQVVFLQSDGPNDTSNMDMSIESDAQTPTHSIPVGADYLVAMATVPGYVSFREKHRGSWFIQSLCKKLQQLVPSGIDLLSILTEVNKDVSSKTGIRKQMPQPEFTLTKRVVFPVPNIPITSSGFT